MQTTPLVSPPMLPDFKLLGQSTLGPTTSQRMQDLFSIAGNFQFSSVQDSIERLEQAFKTMQAHGILTRHDYSCCSVCGNAEIRDEVVKAKQAGLSIDGFVFYPWGAADTASETGRLTLTFGSHIGSGVSAGDIGNRVIQCLRTAGLAAEWKGGPAGHISVTLVSQ